MRNALIIVLAFIVTIGGSLLLGPTIQDSIVASGGDPGGAVIVNMLVSMIWGLVVGVVTAVFLEIGNST